jgi:DNA-binding SARP family transcriptional activator
MDFRVLGPFEVDEGGREVVVGGPRPRALLAILLLRRGEAVPTEALIEQLYGSRPPAGAAKSLQVLVSRLRKSLAGGGTIRTVAGGYALDVDRERVDLDRFEALVDRGRTALANGDAATAASSLEEALALWRGPALADFRYDEFAQSAIAELEERRLAAVEDRVEADLALGRHAELVAELERTIAAHPLRERPRGQLMLALYRSGRQAEALEVFADTRRMLSEELGLEPSVALRTLQRRILEHDPALDPPETPSQAEGTRGFVGRAPELEALASYLDEAVAGRGRLVLVSGEPGIGKSRLAEELAVVARSRGARVLVGRCWEAGGAPAYWPWVQSLRAYMDESEPETLREQLGAGAPVLAQLFPELQERYRDLEAPPSGESEDARFRLFDATAALLRRAARAQPLVVVLDDLHAADEPSLLLLRFLARELGQSRILVVGAYRDVDPSLRDPLIETVGELGRERVTRRIALVGLGESEVGEYIALAGGVEPEPGAVARIHGQTEGNPLFVGELVRLLSAEGRLEDGAGVGLRIPPGVRDVIGSRVRRLSSGCQDLLVLASVLGREFALDVLGDMQEVEPAGLFDVLDEAMTERLVSDIPDAAGRLRFAHALIRDTLYDGLSTSRRLTLHRQAGESLERVHAGDSEPHLAEIAHHYSLAAPLGTRAQAVAYARRAGERAAALVAYEEAARLYELAVGLTDDDAERCELLLALGDVLARSGNTPASKQRFRQAGELAESAGSAELLARASLGYGGRFRWDVSRDDDYTLRFLETALAALGHEDSTVRVRVLARLAGGPLRDASFPSDRKKALSREALSIARRIGDPATLAYALSCFNAAHHSPEQTPEQVKLAGELLGRAREATDLELVMDGHEHRAAALLELGDVPGARADVDAMASLARELRQPAHDWFVAQYEAHLALLEGRLADAEELISEARHVGERALSWSAAVSYGLQLYVLRWLQGRLDEIEGLVRDSVGRFPTYFIWRCIGAHMAATLGHEAESRAVLDTLAEGEFSAVPFDEEWLVSMAFLAETAVALHDAPAASLLHGLLDVYPDRVATSTPEVSIGAVSHYLGRLATTLERWEDAERHFDVALELNERIRALPWLARTQSDYAEMLVRRGAPHERRRADDLRRSSHELADELGMVLA